MNDKPGRPVEAITVSDEELQSLTQAIFQRHGIDFTCYERLSLKRRVIRALGVFNVDSIHALWRLILRDRSFIYSFMDEVSVGLTAMFRDPVLWRKMQYLLNTDFATKSELAIWHAGCSSGEEIYTFGIVLRESLFSNTITAWATDISKQAIEQAQRGGYHVLKFSEYEQNYKDFNPYGSLKRYSTACNGMFQMNNDLIRHVSFEYHNLITDPFPMNQDIIFCRNVMIYFDNGAKLKLLKKFYDSLKPGGLLIIGFYDAVMPLIDPHQFGILDIEAKIFVRL
jgi:chemotaxis protein methyltransferase CheR